MQSSPARPPEIPAASVVAAVEMSSERCYILHTESRPTDSVPIRMSIDREQIEFDFSAAPAARRSPTRARCRFTLLELRQLALGFLAARKPAGLAAQVPVRLRKYQVAAAAFWTREAGRQKEIVRTAVVEIYTARDRCFADCADHRAILESIHELRARRELLQAEIRRREPHLADTDDLFAEYRTWHYERSADPAYSKLLRKLEKLRHTLHKGSRLERIRNAGVADDLYLAVPEGVIEADEIAAGWGLLHITGDGRMVEVTRPEAQLCTPAGRQLLVANIAAAAARSVLFTAGVVSGDGGRVRYYKPPRRRLKRSIRTGPGEA